MKRCSFSRDHTMLCTLVLGVALLLPAPPVAAQEAGSDDRPGAPGWQNGMTVGLNFTQNSFSNWTAGGTGSAAWAWAISGDFDRVGPRSDWENDLSLEYGLIKQEGDELRKSVDRIEFDSVYSRLFGLYLEPYAAASLKTQFTTGRNYNATPDTLAGGELEFPATSNFADPLYLTQSVGVGRQFNPHVKSRLGFAVQEVITDEFRSFACTSDDLEAGVDPADCDRIKVETGLESVTAFDRTFEKTTVTKSRLKLFYSFEQPDQLDVSWRNEVNAKVLKFVSFNFAFELLYDKDVLDKVQSKQVLGLGVSFTLI